MVIDKCFDTFSLHYYYYYFFFLGQMIPHYTNKADITVFERKVAQKVRQNNQTVKVNNDVLTKQ